MRLNKLLRNINEVMVEMTDEEYEEFEKLRYELNMKQWKEAQEILRASDKRQYDWLHKDED